MWHILRRSKVFWIILTYYTLVCFWWLTILIKGQTEGLENYWFNIFYGQIALIGALSGIKISYNRWGGHKSVLGRGIIFLSLGLTGEWLGNAIWGFFNVVLQTEVPYPSLADIGFFSIIPLYSLAAIHFGKLAGVKFAIRSFRGQLQSVIIPLVMVAISWGLFLKNIPFDLTNPLKLFLDFAYPAGEAVFVSLAILTYSLSQKILGGKMRSRILFVVVCLVFQFITEYSFLYRAGNETYYNAGPVDLMYATSITLMSLCILSFRTIEETKA